MTQHAAKETKYKTVPVLMERWKNAQMTRHNEQFHVKLQEQHYPIAVSSKSHNFQMKIKKKNV